MFSRCSVRIVPFVDVFLMPLCPSCSVSKLCPALCDPMNCSTPHQASLPFSISWSLLKLMSVELVIPSNRLIPCVPFSSCLQSFPASGSLQLSWLFASCGQSIGASTSASVLPMKDFNMLSGFVIAFLPRSKHLLISVTICSNSGAQENKVCHCFHYFPIYLP